MSGKLIDVRGIDHLPENAALRNRRKSPKNALEILSEIATKRGATCHELAISPEDRKRVGRILGTLSELGLIHHLSNRRDGQIVMLLTVRGWELIEAV